MTSEETLAAMTDELAAMADADLRFNLGAMDPFIRNELVRSLIADSRELRRLRASLSRLEQEWRKEAGQLEQTAVGELGLSVFRALVHKAEHLRRAADALKSIETR